MNRKILGKFLALFTAISMLAAALPIVGAAEEQLYSAPNGNTIAELVSGGLWTYEYAKAGTTDFNAMETGSGACIINPQVIRERMTAPVWRMYGTIKPFILYRATKTR